MRRKSPTAAPATVIKRLRPLPMRSGQHTMADPVAQRECEGRTIHFLPRARETGDNAQSSALRGAAIGETIDRDTARAG